MLTFLNQSFDLATPANWPRWLRRTFLCLAPLTIPLLIAFWIAIIVAAIAAVLLGICFAVIMEGINPLLDLWD